MWIKVKAINPVIGEPHIGKPDNIAGWRDAQMFHALNDFLQNIGKDRTTSGSLFTIISGGKSQGPKLLLCEDTGKDEAMAQWEHLGSIFERKVKGSFLQWSRNCRANFEMGAHMEMPDGDQPMGFLFLGTERGQDSHAKHWPLWADGSPCDGRCS